MITTRIAIMYCMRRAACMPFSYLLPARFPSYFCARIPFRCTNRPCYRTCRLPAAPLITVSFFCLTRDFVLYLHRYR